MFGFSLGTFALTFLAIAGVGFLVTMWRRHAFSKSARGRIFEGAWINARDFEEDDSGTDGSGCYIILEFDREVEDGDYAGYRAAFVGRGERVCESARARLAALRAEEVEEGPSGNERIFYVQVRPYDEDQIEQRERSIARVLKAQREDGDGDDIIIMRHLRGH